MRAQFRYAMRHDPDSVKVLARRFITTIRVTSIHKKDCKLDAVVYRSIAGDEPITGCTESHSAEGWWYPVRWSAQHQLRSPTLAGFRPRQSPIHPLRLALLH